MDELCWQDVAYKLHFPVCLDLDHLWSLGIWALPRTTNLECLASCHINLAHPHVFISTLAKAI